MLQPVAEASASANASDARLVRLRLGSLEPQAALEAIASSAGIGEPQKPFDGTDPEKLYATEKAALETYRVIPLAYVPQILGLSSRVKNWMPTRWGAWRLEDAWLQPQEATAANAAAPAADAGKKP
jgi:hypothetical protein